MTVIVVTVVDDNNIAIYVHACMEVCVWMLLDYFIWHACTNLVYVPLLRSYNRVNFYEWFSCCDS